MSIVDPTMPGTSTNIWHLSYNTINLHCFTQESKPSHTMEMETMAAKTMVDMVDMVDIKEKGCLHKYP